MKKLFIVVFLAMSVVGVAHAQDAAIPGINSATGADTPTPDTTAAAQAQQQQAGGGTGFVAIAPIPGLTDTNALSVVNSVGLAAFFNNLYKYLIGLAAALAVIMIIWGGLELSTQDSVSKNKDGKEKIYNAIFGLVLVLSPAIVFSIINPAILDLSLNLPPLKTASGPPPSSSTTQRPCGNGVYTNCTQPAPKLEGNSETPVTGQYCYARTDPSQADSPVEYVCAATQALCDNLFSEQIRNDGTNAYVGSSCRLR